MMRSCSSGVEKVRPAKPRSRKKAFSVSSSRMSVRLSGVRIMEAPTYRSSVEAVKPPRSRPAMGWPPM